MNVKKIAKYALWSAFALSIIYCYIRSCTNFWGMGKPEINKIEQLEDGSYIMADTTRFCKPDEKLYYSAHVKDTTGYIDHKTLCIHCNSRWSYHKTSLEWTEFTMSYND